MKLLQTERRQRLEEDIKNTLQEKSSVLRSVFVNSPRTVGDTLETIVQDAFPTFIEKEHTTFTKSISRKSLADFSFTDTEQYNFSVDVKTHRISADFSMPNLISVERLSRLYKDPKSVFVLLMISYKVTEDKVEIEKVFLSPIECISWSNLTIGALGWGQIQLKNLDNLEVMNGTRQEWMQALCARMDKFYSSQEIKMRERRQHFINIGKQWEGAGQLTP